MPSQWTNADFDTMGWHDCHIHGFRLITRSDDSFGCDIEFDIDYILEWLPQPDRFFKFRLAPATLTFHNASQLRMQVDYSGAGMTPFPLADIEREPQVYQGEVRSYHWRLPINGPIGKIGEITFDAPGFTQTLRREPLLHPRQCFTSEERAV